MPKKGPHNYKRQEKTKHRENPFALQAVKQTVSGYRLIKGSNSDLIIVDKNTGEASGLTGFYQRVKVDKTGFVKLYADGMKALLDLSSPGKKVFSIIYALLLDDQMYGKDRVIINYDALTDAQKATLSNTTYWRGIRNLIDKNVLANTLTEGVYWLNPAYIYRGNRLAYCQDYVMEHDVPEGKVIDVTPTVEQIGENANASDTGADTSGANG